GERPLEWGRLAGVHSVSTSFRLVQQGAAIERCCLCFEWSPRSPSIWLDAPWPEQLSVHHGVSCAVKPAVDVDRTRYAESPTCLSDSGRSGSGLTRDVPNM